MNRFAVRIVHCTRATTREGDHPDDRMYMDQLAQTISSKLAELHFVGTVDLVLLSPELRILMEGRYPIMNSIV